MIATPLRPGQYELRVLMAGEPTRSQSMTTVLQDLQQSSLQQKVELQFFNKAPQLGVSHSSLKARIDLWSEWWSMLIIRPNTVAHIHSSPATLLLDGVLIFLARVNQVPVLLQLHGEQFDVFLASLSGPKLWLARWLSSLAGRVVVFSPEIQAKLARYLPSARFVVISNGTVPATAGYKMNSQQLTLLFVGNLSHRKGIQDVVSAMSRLPENCQLVVLGGEDDRGMLTHIRQQIRDLNLMGRVNLLGPVAADSKQYWLNQADIFVLPAHADEELGPVLEAMAAGLPVVVSPVGELASMIRNGENGVLVEPGNVAELTETLQVLIEETALRQSIAKQGQQDCLSRYGIEQSVAAYLRVYTELRV